MEFLHLPNIHFINMISAKDTNIIRIFIIYMEKVLINCISSTFIPTSSSTHLCGNKINVLV